MFSLKKYRTFINIYSIQFEAYTYMGSEKYRPDMDMFNNYIFLGRFLSSS